MTIRRMNEADILQVARIEREVFSQPWSQKSFADALKDSNAVFLVAEGGEDGQDVFRLQADNESMHIDGYIGMYLSVPEGEITNVAVAEDARGCGCAQKLVHAMEQEAAAYGVECIFLEVRDSNKAAIHVYRKLGFEEIGVRKGFYELPKEDARIMRWQGSCEE